MIRRIRRAAGWRVVPAGWFSFDNTPESLWRERGYPFPEDQHYGQWFRSRYGTIIAPFFDVQTV